MEANRANRGQIGHEERIEAWHGGANYHRVSGGQQSQVMNNMCNILVPLF